MNFHWVSYKIKNLNVKPKIYKYTYVHGKYGKCSHIVNNISNKPDIKYNIDDQIKYIK